jgi:hypothetical protein
MTGVNRKRVGWVPEGVDGAVVRMDDGSERSGRGCELVRDRM